MAANNISIIISAKDNASRSIKGVSSELDKSVDSSKKADKAFKSFATTLGVGLLVAGTAAAGGMGVAIKSAGTYESSLSQLKQASQATGDEMADMAELARELGSSNDLAGVSAADAAKTMVELSKAGLSVKDTMDSAKSVMSLAKAGNIQFADAAVIAASALNAFGLKGTEANKVADMLAAGANASQAELADLADGMQQSATVAKQFGLNMNETVTALSLFANNGIKGSDAGTSLKTMLIALSRPSKEAAALMEEIGFNAYDATGKFVGLEEMSKRLKTATAGLTDEQKQNTLATIFGTDAFRAAAVLADNAGLSYDSMSKSVGKVGAAQQAAAAQMGPYERATEGLRNAFSELGLTIGTMALPYVTQLTNNVSAFVSTVNAGIPGAIDTFQQFGPVLGGLTAGIIAFTVAQNAATWATKAMTVAQGALNLAMKANPVALLTGAVIGITAAFIGSMHAANANKNSLNSLTDAKRNAKAASDDLRNAELSLEQANLRVERAKRSEAEAIRQYGRGTLEAREATASLKQAQYDQANASDRARSAANSNKTAQQDLAAANRSTQASEGSKAVSINNTTAAIGSQSSALVSLRQRLQSINGLNVSYRIQETRAAAVEKGYKSGAPFKNANAIGTVYSPGGRTLVGENGPEIVNLPRGSQVTQSYRSRNEMAEGGSAASVMVNITGPVTFNDRSDIDYFAERISKTQRLARMGMAS